VIKPYKIALFLIAIQLILLSLIWLFPKKGVQLSDDILVEFSKPEDFYPKEKHKVEVIQEVFKQYALEDLSEEGLMATDVDSSILDETIILDEKERIVHPSDFENGLYAFYHKLNKIDELGQPLRILHFGDSQLEGDRISGVVRENLQSIFGGCGVGFIPISETNTGRLNVIKREKGWERYQVFGKGRKGTHNKYGFLGYYYNVEKDSIQNGNASVVLRKNSRYFKHAQNFELFSLLYGNVKSPVDYTLKTDTGIISKGNLVKTSGVNRRIWQMNGFDNGKVDLRLSTNNTPNIYGVSMDCRSGIAVDNIALRGSSGTDFTKMDKEALKQQFKDLNVGLVIFQFGLNVVPAELNNYNYYERMIFKQLKLIKSVLPNASILVISVTDACKNEEESYANIDKVRDAQKRAAQRSNCAFWDLYEVMGGNLSMPSWVNAEPSLAEKDFKHFNARGAKVVGNKLFRAIIADYNDFKTTSIQ
jgi:hypothetical protein